MQSEKNLIELRKFDRPVKQEAGMDERSLMSEAELATADPETQWEQQSQLESISQEGMSS